MTCEVTSHRTQLEERGFSCGLWVDPPGQLRSDYVHETDELVMVVEGDVEFEIDGKAHRPSPGEELLIPARARNLPGDANLTLGTPRRDFRFRPNSDASARPSLAC
jgi:quercetin dioxygenase-like cupin family protein